MLSLRVSSTFKHSGLEIDPIPKANSNPKTLRTRDSFVNDEQTHTQAPVAEPKAVENPSEIVLVDSDNAEVLPRLHTKGFSIVPPQSDSVQNATSDRASHRLSDSSPLLASALKTPKTMASDFLVQRA